MPNERRTTQVEEIIPHFSLSHRITAGLNGMVYKVMKVLKFGFCSQKERGILTVSNFGSMQDGSNIFIVLQLQTSIAQARFNFEL